ncbi:hypothetical protein [Carboxylicivirga sp. N1Y90]|uniref:hypothetical protein n=1 Tax=Carboxylicivirga fragile TaxID=3417571 RepID=UPI003D337EA0|nr:hypothetical protein [Marinilabiliaceae bacterium N1Y90]
MLVKKIEGRYRMKIRNSLRYSLFLIALLAFTVVACEDNYNPYNPQEQIDAENKLLDDYYNELIDGDLTRLQVMSASAFDTVDHRRESGLMLFHNKVTDLDSVGLFKQVGYRYKVYSIGRDETSGEIVEVALDSNYYSPSPAVYTTYIINDGNSAKGTGVALGINEAIQHMREGSKATIILPSSIGGVSGYFSTKYELEVTYLEN